MKTTTLSDFRKNAKTLLDKAHGEHDILIVKRKESKDMVLLSLEDYDELVGKCSRLKI